MKLLDEADAWIQLERDEQVSTRSLNKGDLVELTMSSSAADAPAILKLDPKKLRLSSK
jgi:hypothetical protein